MIRISVFRRLLLFAFLFSKTAIMQLYVHWTFFLLSLQQGTSDLRCGFFSRLSASVKGKTLSDFVRTLLMCFQKEDEVIRT